MNSESLFQNFKLILQLNSRLMRRPRRDLTSSGGGAVPFKQKFEEFGYAITSLPINIADRLCILGLLHLSSVFAIA